MDDGVYMDCSNPPIYCWPTNPDRSYFVALEGNQICWLDKVDGIALVINVAKYDSFDKSTLVIKKQHTLEGHVSDIGLLLTTAGKLLSFDELSMVFIWCLETYTLLRTIDTFSKIDQIIVSMNVHNDRLVTGGHNKSIAVWDINTGDCMYHFRINDDSRGGTLNVGIWDDLIVYGLSNGTYGSHCIRTKTFKHEFSIYPSRISAENSPSIFEDDVVHTFLLEEEEDIPENILHGSPTDADLSWMEHFNSTPIAQPNQTIGIQQESVITEPSIPQAENVPDDLPTVDLPNGSPALSGDNSPWEGLTGSPINTNTPLPVVTELPLLEHHFHQLDIMPRTLALNGHFLITNSIDDHSILIWDVNTGQLIRQISEQLAARNLGFDIPFRNIRLAEFGKGGDLIHATLENGWQTLIWDFNQQRSCNVLKVVLECTQASATIDVFMCMPIG
ncbi:hypothetical protein HDV02_006131 [Globomyces sp. JEL0801]|nr:hypothetical protein HDV02_006131 [Globomyces sp. JEL0801]